MLVFDLWYVSVIMVNEQFYWLLFYIFILSISSQDQLTKLFSLKWIKIFYINIQNIRILHMNMRDIWLLWKFNCFLFFFFKTQFIPKHNILVFKSIIFLLCNLDSYFFSVCEKLRSWMQNSIFYEFEFLTFMLNKSLSP